MCLWIFERKNEMASCLRQHMAVPINCTVVVVGCAVSNSPDVSDSSGVPDSCGVSVSCDVSDNSRFSGV